VRVLELFAGIGGMALGLERAGMETVGLCEIDPACRFWLREHWPEVPIWEDVTTLTGVEVHERIGTVDLLAGGVPCQPFSSASRGRKAGTADARWLWPEMFRLTQELEPPWVVLENVAQFDGVALEQVASDLETGGYEVQALEIPACAVGCDHRRERLWILGYSDSHRESSRPVNAEVARMPWGDRDAGGVGPEDGLPGRMAALQAYGNAVVPQVAEAIGRAILSQALE